MLEILTVYFIPGEMKSFTKANMEDSLEFTWSLFILLLIVNCYIGIILALAVIIFNINRIFHSRGDEIVH